MFEFIQALAILGTPVALLSWFLIRRLYVSGRLEHSLDYGTTRHNIANLKKTWKQDGDHNRDFIESRWMKFGGGFYGITALTTLVTIEMRDFFQFVTHFPGFDSLLSQGVISLIIDILLNQLQNFISALVWFAYWVDEDDTFLIWIAAPYLGYLVGMKLAGLWLPQPDNTDD